ncbi:PREDICTED: ER membrane protein complex subunit 6 [Diuraphis noxia]|uniref:ER membrane protein complex subunit 6 n=1 Tax=Acyrthosiphon pisum TaxID=7029 RepID=A0A8R2A2L6_ACYPI|nr:ER membrane protein complex subunit 6 isoform X2 [Acyrthosiphon pisum]XP_015380407.1 PREDICTED: ER membrane protein complex subunit 6 [Diuraphis noxia]|eukprot:XP_001944919.1 PREDICTED: ER membrane protein complex subunit 6 isoform X2 [Acyrthosiphon pisum]
MTENKESKETKFKELVSYSEPALRNNSSVVEYCRTSMSALSGCTAGILGLTGLSGFIFYIFSVLALWGLLLFKAGNLWQKYFLNRHSLLTGGFFSGLFTYVLFWTFLYGMVHVY